MPLPPSKLDGLCLSSKNKWEDSSHCCSSLPDRVICWDALVKSGMWILTFVSFGVHRSGLISWTWCSAPRFTASPPGFSLRPDAACWECYWLTSSEAHEQWLQFSFKWLLYCFWVVGGTTNARSSQFCLNEFVVSLHSPERMSHYRRWNETTETEDIAFISLFPSELAFCSI